MTENNKYIFELDTFTCGTIRDTVEAQNLMEAFNIVDGTYGVDGIEYKNFKIELLKKG
jgi:hypothetical protein